MFDEIVRILEDGRCHELEEITNRTVMSEERVQGVVNFLSNYGFAQVDIEYKKIRLNPDFLKLPM